MTILNPYGGVPGIAIKCLSVILCSYLPFTCVTGLVGQRNSARSGASRAEARNRQRASAECTCRSLSAGQFIRNRGMPFTKMRHRLIFMRAEHVVKLGKMRFGPTERRKFDQRAFKRGICSDRSQISSCCLLLPALHF